MHRLTTDTPKDNFEMALNLFYVKDEEVWVRGYGKDGADISLLNLTREILSHQCPYVESDISDDDLIMMMPEWLFDDVRATEHVIGLLYQEAWVCAELREHLKQFEDTKRTPEQIEALEAAIMGKAVAQITEFEGLPACGSWPWPIKRGAWWFHHASAAMSCGHTAITRLSGYIVLPYRT